MSSIHPNPNDVCNINLGIMGHVDSGKTTLVKSLSQTLSTASLDKSPQSRERGITLDLGFSSFMSPIPSHLESSGYKYIQYTLVDCPGHASLIRTIIGGAQIIDLLLIVIDCQKGIQAQTAECLVIGEICTKNTIFVLNKIDLFPANERTERISVITSNIKKTLVKTRFKNSLVIPVAAQVGGGSIGDQNTDHLGIAELTSAITQSIVIPSKIVSGPMYLIYDHSFTISGKGAVLTGTVLAGSLHVNDDIEFPSLHTTRKVKSLQIFHQSVNECVKGDRVGIGIQSIDLPNERGEVCSPGSLARLEVFIARVNRIRFFKGDISSGHSFHFHIGHNTVVGSISLFCDSSMSNSIQNNECGSLMFPESPNSFEFAKEYEQCKEYPEKEDRLYDKNMWCLITLEHAVFAPIGSLFIASQLNQSTSSQSHTSCRIAFFGKSIHVLPDNKTPTLAQLHIFKQKKKKMIVDRVANEYDVICNELINKGSDITKFIGLKVSTQSGICGEISGSFGQSGKFKVHFVNEHKLTKGDEIEMNIKKYMYDSSDKIRQ